ncbi:MAG: hypothetical protein AAGB00_04690 [Planctomycetota bacterium]
MNAYRRLCRALPAWVVLLVVGVLAGGVNAWLVALNPPAPRVHDEFSYLLSADTFLEGRLTNPTHAHWPHFETMHVIHQPSYASKYPPGQGLLLAAGKALTGWSMAGVCFATGLAAAACVWMLRVWMPMRWAVVGGLLVAFHAGIQLQWGMSYWGGALAMAAGAAVVGGAARLARPNGPLLTSAIAYAMGALTLAVTRPFEGCLLVVGSAVIVAWGWLRADQMPRRRAVTRVVAPAAFLGAAGGAGLLGYNATVTGDPLRMPYQVHEQDYGATPLFVWQAPTADHEYRHDPLRRYHLAASMWWHHQQQTFDGFVTLKAWLTRCSLEFFLPAPIALATLAIGWSRRRRLWPWLLLGIGVWGASLGAVWMFPHYLAPIAPLLLLAVVAGLRSFRTLERRLPSRRRWITPSLVMLQTLIFAFAAYDRAKAPREGWAYTRQALTAELVKMPGQDLVFVHYAPNHNVHDEWVYNRADIDAAPVVWARELGGSADEALRDYFHDRRVWVLHADEQPKRLVPYEAPSSGDIAGAPGELASG